METISVPSVLTSSRSTASSPLCLPLLSTSTSTSRLPFSSRAPSPASLPRPRLAATLPRDAIKTHDQLAWEAPDVELTGRVLPLFPLLPFPSFSFFFSLVILPFADHDSPLTSSCSSPSSPASSFPKLSSNIIPVRLLFSLAQSRCLVVHDSDLDWPLRSLPLCDTPSAFGRLSPPPCPPLSSSRRLLLFPLSWTDQSR
jgi:hypothetical protein